MRQQYLVAWGTRHFVVDSYSVCGDKMHASRRRNERNNYMMNCDLFCSITCLWSIVLQVSFWLWTCFSHFGNMSQDVMRSCYEIGSLVIGSHTIGHEHHRWWTWLWAYKTLAGSSHWNNICTAFSWKPVGTSLIAIYTKLDWPLNWRNIESLQLKK